MKKYQKKLFRKGRFGEVNLYENILTSGSYAIKTISIERIKEEDIQKLKKELTPWKEINSDYVIKCYDLFIEHSNLYFVLEH